LYFLSISRLLFDVLWEGIQNPTPLYALMNSGGAFWRCCMIGRFPVAAAAIAFKG